MTVKNSEKDSPLWVYPKKDEALKAKLVREFRIHPVTAQILISRGFKTLEEVHQFLYAKLPDLYDPGQFNDMNKACRRVLQAIENKEGILIYGDNDVDGMTGTALLVDFLRYIGAKVTYYISSRGVMRDQLILEAEASAKKQNCSLIITVDCGITAAREIAKLAKAGLDVIITDHHEPTDRLPKAVATLNPKLLHSTYPNRELTGVGVAFKLAHGIALMNANHASAKKVDLKRYLDLVALGTIADMGVLLGENRILVRYGLQQLRKTSRVGLAKLVQICDLDLTEVTSSDIVFKIAPRLNSLGRIDDPQKGVELLLVKGAQEAERMAYELNLNNTERQRIERVMSLEVESMLESSPEILQQKGFVLSSNKWHPGVIAIISTRLTKQYHRPSVLLAVEKEIAKGSLRSIPQFPLLTVLKELSSLLVNFGGHDLAAGLTIETKNIPAFKQAFLEKVNQQLKPDDIENKLVLDAKIDFSDLNFELLESNKLLEPFGNENHPPVFYAIAGQSWAPKVIGKTHLKLFLEQNDRILEGIAMNRAGDRQLLKEKKKPIQVAFTPQLNLFQKDSIQLLIRDYLLDPVQATL